MSDLMITEFGEETDPSSGALIAIVNDPGGDPLNKKLYLSNLSKIWAATTGFWLDIQGGVITRFGDRVFIGAAVDNDGKLINITEDWLEVLREDTVSNSQLAVLSTIGQQAILGASRTSDFDTADSMGCMGGSFWAINDNTDYPQTAYAGYFEAQRYAGCGWTHGIEIDVANWGNEVDALPYNIFPSGATFNLWLASGNGPSYTGNSVSLAIGILKNTEPFLRGIVFSDTALNGNDGVTGSAEAIVLPKGDAIIWYFTGNNQGFQINSQIALAADRQSIQAAAEGIYFNNNSDLPEFLINKVSGTITGYVATTPSTSATPQLEAVGSATNIDLRLAAKGSGLLDARVAPAGSAGAATGTYLPIKVNGTEYRLALLAVS